MGTQLGAPLKPLIRQYYDSRWGFRGHLNWSPKMPFLAIFIRLILEVFFRVANGIALCEQMRMWPVFKLCKHRRNFFQIFPVNQTEIRLYLLYIPIDLEPNGRPFGSKMLNQTEIRFYLPCTDWFGTKPTSVCSSKLIGKWWIQSDFDLI